jgi:hypothetical protein
LTHEIFGRRLPQFPSPKPSSAKIAGSCPPETQGTSQSIAVLATNERIKPLFVRSKILRAYRRVLLIAFLPLALCMAAAVPSRAQVSGQNVNMVSGTNWTNGDPFLQRQNEPSIAVSSRNSSHLLAGANDYRTVDLPGLLGIDERGDAWLGLFKSFDGGRTWQSTLLPGFPLDGSPQGQASPIRGFQRRPIQRCEPAQTDSFTTPGSSSIATAIRPGALYSSLVSSARDPCDPGNSIHRLHLNGVLIVLLIDRSENDYVDALSRGDPSVSRAHRALSRQASGGPPPGVLRCG